MTVLRLFCTSSQRASSAVCSSARSPCRLTHLGQLGADPLRLLGSEYLGHRGVRDVDRLGHRDLPVQQLVDPLGRARPGQRAADVRLRRAAAARLARPAGGPVAHPPVQQAEPAGRPEHDPLVVQLGGDQPPARVLRADPHRDRNAHVGVVRRVHVVRAVVGDDRRPGVARIGGVDDQDGQALVLRRSRDRYGRRARCSRRRARR